MSLLCLKNLNVQFKTENGSIVAVENISFDIAKGQTLGIVGESGSGKSVTALALMGLLPEKTASITSGRALFTTKSGNTIDLFTLHESQKQQYRGNEISMIFQEPMTSLNPVYKCGRQVAEALILHKKMGKNQAKDAVLHWFHEVMLPNPEKIYNSYPHELSGGQRQRVMIAMAMCCEPSLLIADEPTTALDVTVQKSILELMKTLQKKYFMSILFITHDLGVVAEIAENVAVVYKGNIVESGNVKDIFSNPKHPYTKGLLACRPKFSMRYKKLPTVESYLENRTDNLFETISLEERQQLLDAIYKKNPLLQVQELKSYFRIKNNFFSQKKKYYKAVDGVSFSIYPGETLGLVGESGCGKTTLGRTLLQLIKPTDGKVLYMGKNLSEYSKKKLREIRKDLQIIFQDPYSSLNPRITIGKAITEVMKVHKIGTNHTERLTKAAELLKEVNLDESFLHRYPHELSGGQRQRVCIARVLAMNPRFIICDESVSALDVSVQAQVLNLLNQLKSQHGFSLLFISHDLSVVRFMSDRMMVMQNGKIVEYDDADKICSSPQTEYTKKLLNSIPKGF